MCARGKIRTAGQIETLRLSDHLHDFVEDKGPDVIELSTIEKWRILDWFFMLPYFERVWIIQEVATKRNLTSYFENDEIEWWRIGMVAAWLKCHSSRVRSMHPWFNIEGPERADFLFDSRLMAEPRWLALLSLAREYKATDPRDKIYALIGNPKVRWGIEAGTRHIRPDPSLTTEQVFMNVAKRSIEQASNVDILSFVNHEEGLQISSFPTWVPRWDLRSFASALVALDRRFTAWPDSITSQLHIRDAAPSLVLQGVELDSVATIHPTFWDENINPKYDPSDPNFIADLWFKFALESRGYPTNQSCAAAFLSTLAAGGRGQTLTAEQKKAFSADCSAYLFPLLTRLRQYMPSRDRRRADAELKVLKELRGSGDAERFHKTIAPPCCGRRFFVTRRGYFGLGSNAMKVEDRVCLFQGGKTAYLVRPTGRQAHHFIGDAYVHGLMNGEMLPMLRSGRLRGKEFVLE